MRCAAGNHGWCIQDLGLEFDEYSFHVHDSLQSVGHYRAHLTPLIVAYALSLINHRLVLSVQL